MMYHLYQGVDPRIPYISAHPSNYEQAHDFRRVPISNPSLYTMNPYNGGHTHAHFGATTCQDGHTHIHPGVTSNPIPTPDGHIHIIRGFTEASKE